MPWLPTAPFPGFPGPSPLKPASGLSASLSTAVRAAKPRWPHHLLGLHTCHLDEGDGAPAPVSRTHCFSAALLGAASATPPLSLPGSLPRASPLKTLVPFSPPRLTLCPPKPRLTLSEDKQMSLFGEPVPVLGVCPWPGPCCPGMRFLCPQSSLPAPRPISLPSPPGHEKLVGKSLLSFMNSFWVLGAKGF